MTPKVLIVLPTDKFLHRQILEGILDHGRKGSPWQFHFETGDRYEQGLANGRRWGCSGIIAMVRERRQLNRILATRIPAVILNPPVPARGRQFAPPPWATFVNRNQENVGRTAAEHFLERGFSRFAFVGIHDAADWCDRRQAGFLARLAESGHNCEVYRGAPRPARASFDLETRYLADFLRSLQPGTALYAVRDRRAIQVLGICLDLGITVPVSAPTMTRCSARPSHPPFPRSLSTGATLASSALTSSTGAWADAPRNRSSISPIRAS